MSTWRYIRFKWDQQFFIVFGRRIDSFIHKICNTHSCNIRLVKMITKSIQWNINEHHFITTAMNDKKRYCARKNDFELRSSMNCTFLSSSRHWQLPSASYGVDMERNERCGRQYSGRTGPCLSLIADTERVGFGIHHRFID